MITYDDKVTLVDHPEIAEINKITDDNMNEIKSEVNTNITATQLAQTSADNAQNAADDAQNTADGAVSSSSSHASNTSNPHNVTKTQVGLGNVDNTSDSGKPVSTATQTALDLKKPLPVSEAFTATITFDARNKFSTTTQTGAIAIALAGSGHLDNSDYQMEIIGNGSGALTISSAFNVQGVLDNSKRNVIFFKYIDSSTKPIAVIYTEPLVTFIDDYSLSISVNTPNNSASLSDSGSTLDFTNGSGTDVAGSFFCWIKLGAVGINQAIMVRSTNAATYIQFLIDTANKLNIFFQTSGVNYITKLQTTATLTTGIWTHVGFTKSAVEAHTSLTLYINGLAVAGTGGVTGTYTGVASGGTTKIGWQDAGGTVTGNFLIDHATFVNKEMTAAEFIEAYNGGYAFNELTASFAADILAYYRFEQNANDLTGNGHTGTIVTAVYSTAHP